MLIYASCENIVFSKSRKEINSMKEIWLGAQSFTTQVSIGYMADFRIFRFHHVTIAP